MDQVFVRHTSPDTGNYHSNSSACGNGVTKHHWTGSKQSADSGSTVGQFGNKYTHLNRPAKMGIQKTKISSGEEKCLTLK